MNVHDYLRSCGLNDEQIADLFGQRQITVNGESCDDPDRALAVGARPGVRQLGALIVASGLVELRPGGPPLTG